MKLLNLIYLYFQQLVTVCGYSLEINASTDMNFFLSVQQTELLVQIMNTNILQMLKMGSQGHPETSTSMLEGKEDVTLTDSGIDTEVTIVLTKIEEEKQDHVEVKTDKPALIDWKTLTPFDILLTAGKISCMLYSCKPTGVNNGGTVGDARSEQEVTLDPFLYASFSQPHTMFKFCQATQKIELSCYDIILKGTRGEHTTGRLFVLKLVIVSLV